MQTEPIRIAHILGAMNYGGVESMALRLIRGLAEPMFSHVVIDMAAADRAGERQGEFLRLVEVRKSVYRPGRRLGFILSCAQTLRRVKPDRVLAYNFGNHWMVAVAAWLARVPVTYVRVAGSPLRDRSTQWKSMVLAHLARPFCRGEIAVSESVGAQLTQGLRLPARRVRVIPNGCEIGEIAARAAAARAGRTNSFPWKVVMVSRMDDAKDHATLLKSAAQLLREGCQMEVLLLGDGPSRKDHEALAIRLGIWSRVRFLGSRSDVPELLGASDVLVHCTHTEGFPNVLIEGMAAGIPVVTTDIPVCREILADGRCGMLVPPRDSQALARVIKQVLTDSNLRSTLTAAASERVRALYDVRIAITHYAQVLAAPVAAPGRV